MSGAHAVFDRRAVRAHRDRSAAGAERHDFLLREVGERLTDRLLDVRRRFPLALDLGCRHGLLGDLLAARGGARCLVQCDLAPALLRRAAEAGGAAERLTLAADEEILPFHRASFDLVVSNLALHWVNDLPGCLLQIRNVLKPDGLFLASLFGPETLAELRAALTQAELDESGGAHPRVAPFAEMAELGALLQRAGFALPVVDADSLTVSYSDALGLMRDLRGMGETNAVRGRARAFSRRTLFARTAAAYAARHAGSDGRLPATFQIVYLTAWAPHPSQQKPLPRGSGRMPLGHALDGETGAAAAKLPDAGAGR